MPFGYVDKYLFGLTRPNWSLVELVKVLSVLLDRYIAIRFLFLFPHADTDFIFLGGDALNPVPLLRVLIYSALSQFSIDIFLLFTVSTKLHEVSGSTEVTLSLNGNNKDKIAFILIFMIEDFWKTSQGWDWDFLVLPGAKAACCFSHRWFKCVNR